MTEQREPSFFGVELRHVAFGLLWPSVAVAAFVGAVDFWQDGWDVLPVVAVAGLSAAATIAGSYRILRIGTPAERSRYGAAARASILLLIVLATDVMRFSEAPHGVRSSHNSVSWVVSMVGPLALCGYIAWAEIRRAVHSFKDVPQARS